MSGEILVIGAANTDLTTYADRIPEGGETIHGNNFTTGFGGKGANQAVAAKRAGATVALIAGLGADIFGENTKSHLETEGIDTSGIFYGKQPSGVAHIWVDAKGENRIIIVPGANLELTEEFISNAVLKSVNLSIVIAQCELPQEFAIAAFKSAKKKGAITILNPAPAVKLSAELISLSDWIIPNQIEFNSLSSEIHGGDLIEQIKIFHPDKNLLVTLGSDGAILRTNQGEIIKVTAPKTEVIDTTGAGDGFVGAFAAALSAGKELRTALEFAIKFATNSVSKKGAQSSYPTDLKII
ncbi:MAG: ribokinase [Actinobacteria bacterium]|uniref:Ribokinase n=1 Tax=freshwater metagenome TaxID=449393 RepID=A0A6J6MZB9_9ZZZZ|nr:ribokinase [Actinomycetota bacterium]